MAHPQNKFGAGQKGGVEVWRCGGGEQEIKIKMVEQTGEMCITKGWFKKVPPLWKKSHKRNTFIHTIYFTIYFVNYSEPKRGTGMKAWRIITLVHHINMHTDTYNYNHFMVGESIKDVPQWSSLFYRQIYLSSERGNELIVGSVIN